MRVLLVITAIAAGCSAPPQAERLSTLQASVVIDTTVHATARLFRLVVIKSTTTESKIFSCADYPTTYDLGDSRLQIIKPVELSWTGSRDDAVIEKIRIPANQSVAVLVAALAPTADGKPFNVGRGCLDSVTVSEGTSATKWIDVRATTGASCQSTADCENSGGMALECQTDPAFNGGYCAKLSCNGDFECPPGARCIPYPATGGFCARQCQAQGNNSDCERGQQCVGRIDSSASCSPVCLPTSFAAQEQC
ncbi:MAG: hypothetical protein H6707_02725 [Deltaproteobacteria bacterium]|nr:hypothetical protein [Deltaproteobacteria bacterium]